jgi:hypothetical protein
MKNKILLILLIVPCTLFAQLQVGNVDLNFGEKIESKDGELVRIAGVANNTIYALANKKKKYYLQTFDATTKRFKASVHLDFDKINGNKLDIEDLAVIDGNVYLMLSYYDKDKDSNNFIAKEIKGKEFLESVHILSVPVEKKREKGTFVFTPSYDESHYLVAHVGINSRKEELNYTIGLVNGVLDNVVSDTYNITFEDNNRQYFDFSDIQVNEHGDILIATTQSYRDKELKTAINNITIHAYVAENGYQKQVTEVSLTGKRALNCSLIETSDNVLHAIGFYSDLKDSGRAESTVEGIYAVTLDYKTGAVIKQTFNDFTFDIKKQLIGERRAKKGKDLKPFYRNISFVERDNGGVTVLSEFYRVVEGNTTGIGPLSATTYIFHSNEIIVTALNPDGTLDWSNVIPKEQKVAVSELGFSLGSLMSAGGGVSVSAGFYIPLAMLGKGPEFLSAIPIYHKGALTVIVNDDPKNIGITAIDDVRPVRNIDKMIPVAFTFDEDTGAISRTDPESYEWKQIVLRPAVHYIMYSGHYLIYGGNKKGNSIGELIVND